MPKKLPKNSNWVQLTKDFVKEWPEVLEDLEFQHAGQVPTESPPPS